MRFCTTHKPTIAQATLACVLSLTLAACAGGEAATNAGADGTGGDAAADAEQQIDPKAESNEKLKGFDVTKEQAKKARSFITVYVATHVRNVGDEGDPMEMTQEDWISNCMSYVDPDSELGKAFKEHPETLRSPYGTRDKRVVDATKVSDAGEDNAILVTATVEATTQGWDKAGVHKESYCVRFGDSSRIVAVEPRGMQPTS